MTHAAWITNPFKVMALAVLLVAGGHALPARAAATGDVVDVAAGAGSFNTLVAAIKAAGLVFAPTDAAFAALPAGTLDDLLKPANKEKLKSILLYHVVPGKVMSGDLKGTINAATLQGKSATIIAVAGGVTVNGAKVVTADVAASNGVIHVIDAVILPPAN